MEEYDCFSVKSLLTDIRLALEICFVAEVTQIGENIYILFSNGKKFKLSLEKV